MSLTRSYDRDSWTLSEDGQKILTVREVEEDGKIKIWLSGSLRSDTLHMFKDELTALISLGKDIVLDCGELSYIANACQEALLTTQQMSDSLHRGTLTLVNVPSAIYAEFQKTNLHELLMIE